MFLSRMKPRLMNESSSGIWTDLPDNLLLHIFGFLTPKEIALAGEVCRDWLRISKDEMLWKRLFHDTLFGSSRNNVESPRSSSWFEEFKWIHLNTPLVEGQVLQEHTDEVLHVTFSHHGKLMATSSKDCSVILWRVVNCHHVSMMQKMEFEPHNWEYVQFCQFNASDTLLLVSGVNKVRDLSFRGEIFICELEGPSVVRMRIIHSVNSVPYDVFGAWLSDRCYISGTFEFIPPDNGGTSVSELWKNCADDDGNIFQTKLARIVNKNAGSVRTVLVAKPSTGLQPVDSPGALHSDDDVCLIFTHGTVTYIPHQIVFKWLNSKHGSNSHTVSELMNSSDTDEAESLFVKQDHCIETNSHIIGMSLSPDHQYLYVNCRPWEKRQDGKEITVLALDFPPEISNKITMRVYSVSTYELVSVHVGHEAYTPNDGCFFIFLNVADKLVASGAEDKCTHVWDRYYGAKLATLKGHTSVVNCVAFNPVNQQMLVSVSDDHTIRVWRSRQLSKLHENDKPETEENCQEVSVGDEELFRETSV